MKTRNGFVSNSSSTSFVCVICDEKYEGFDLSPSDVDCYSCLNGHIMCSSHFDNVTFQPVKKKGCEHEFDREKNKFCAECGKAGWEIEEIDTRELLPEYCPVCKFELYSEEEMALYLEKTRKTPRDEVFAKVKAVNKRRRKLYDSEYITYVCEQYGLTDEIILKEVKDKFGEYYKYSKFIYSIEQ